MMFPESWRETTVENVILDLQPGFAQKPGEENDGTTPQIRTHNITPDGKVSLEGIKHISASNKESQRYTLIKGDVIFNNTNSEEWVGKSAVFDQEDEYVFSNHMTRLRVNPELLMPEYLATYLHLLWSMGYSKTRAKRWVSQAGIDSAALSSFKIPLPTLFEQKRIVDILIMAEGFLKKRATTETTLQTLMREHYLTLFGDVLQNDKEWTMRKIGNICTVVRGSSPRPQGDPRLFGGPVPRLMVSDLTRDGLWVDAITDSLTEEGAKYSRPMSARSVIVAVSGAPGLTAILNHDTCIHDGFVGLRDLHSELNPEYLAYTLNLLRSKHDQQAVGAVFRNLTTDQVKAINIPVPPIKLQKQFQDFLLQVRTVQHTIAKSKRLVSELFNELTINAFWGSLTKSWRDAHKEEIKAAAAVRDALLRERGVKLKTATPEPSVPETKAIESLSPSRQWVVGELSGFQRQVLEAFLAYTDQPLIVEDENAFITFCGSDEVTERLQDFGAALNNRIRRTLSQLAALGLIAQVTLPKYNEETGERDYLKAFRPLRETDFSKLSDIESIKRALNPLELEEE